MSAPELDICAAENPQETRGDVHVDPESGNLLDADRHRRRRSCSRRSASTAPHASALVRRDLGLRTYTQLTFFVFASVFVKIEALVEEKAGRKNYPVRVWQKLITKPNRAEELAAELDQEMTLFNVCFHPNRLFSLDTRVASYWDPAQPHSRRHYTGCCRRRPIRWAGAFLMHIS